MGRKATFSNRPLRLSAINVPEPIEEPIEEPEVIRLDTAPEALPAENLAPEPEPEPVPDAAGPIDAGALVRVVVSRELVRADLREHSPVGACVAAIRLAPGWTMGALLDHLKQHYCVAQ